MAHDVFISYSSQDKPTADAVCNGLESAGIRCWIAPRDIVPGQEWGAAIIEAIRSSRLMLIILSAEANASKQVLREVERAVHQAIPIIPFRIEDFELASALEYYLSAPHWLDAKTGPLEQHIRLLVSTVHTLLGDDLPIPADAGASGAPLQRAALVDNRLTPGLGSPAIRTGSRTRRLAGGIVAGLLLTLAATAFVLSRMLSPGVSSAAHVSDQTASQESPPTSIAADGSPLTTLTDDFSDPSLGWFPRSYTDPGGEFTGGYEGGEYLIRSLAPVSGKAGGVFAFGREERPPGTGPGIRPAATSGPGAYADASIAVDARIVGASPGVLLGMTCRQQSGGNGYRLTVLPERGTFSLIRVASGQVAPRVPGTPSGAIRRGNATNRIELRCKGDTISASINGTPLTSVSDATFHQGSIGLFAATIPGDAPRNANVHFDNLVLGTY